MSLWRRLTYWWDARANEPYRPSPRSPIYDIYAGNYRRYGIVRLLRGISSFYLRHWQWVISTIIAIGGLYLAVLALK